MAEKKSVKDNTRKSARITGLTAAEKAANRKLAKLRVRVEHAIAGVKRSRIVKDVFRNKKPGLSDVVHGDRLRPSYRPSHIPKASSQTLGLTISEKVY